MTIYGSAGSSGYITSTPFDPKFDDTVTVTDQILAGLFKDQPDLSDGVTVTDSLEARLLQQKFVGIADGATVTDEIRVGLNTTFLEILDTVITSELFNAVGVSCKGPGISLLGITSLLNETELEITIEATGTRYPPRPGDQSDVVALSDELSTSGQFHLLLQDTVSALGLPFKVALNSAGTIQWAISDNVSISDEFTKDFDPRAPVGVHNVDVTDQIGTSIDMIRGIEDEVTVGDTLVASTGISYIVDIISPVIVSESLGSTVT